MLSGRSSIRKSRPPQRRRWQLEPAPFEQQLRVQEAGYWWQLPMGVRINQGQEKQREHSLDLALCQPNPAGCESYDHP